ncbi:MAG: vitamin K epoxide reductase family protein [Patescibacteria group bacterium]
MPQQLVLTSRRLLVAIAAVSFLGILDTSYLVAKHFIGGPVKCVLVQGCDTVTSSVYSSILGVPVALLGLIYYLVFFFIAFWAIDRESSQIKKLLLFLAIIGVLFSSWFLYVQAFILSAYCTYCLVSALTSILNLIFSGSLLVNKN